MQSGGNHNSTNDDHARHGSAAHPAAASQDYETRVSELWKQLLGLPQVSIDDNFFEVGGTSLLATLLLKRINEAFGEQLSIATIFEHATIRSFARMLRGESSADAAIPTNSTQAATSATTSEHGKDNSAIAIIGITGRFPGAESVEEFWKNLCDGVESITFLDREQLEPSERLIAEQNESYVSSRPLLKAPDLFDAEFFGIYPKEAAQMDPQHRIFLECAWEVLERAGYAPDHTPGSVGVFAGCSMNTYFMRNLADQRGFVEDFTGNYQVGNYSTMMGNDKDFLPTRISYKLNLSGPSMSVQSACSTALVAVSQACQSLMTEGCDMALAGAVSVTFPLHRGYVPQEGGLASMDGHCRPFDEKASGTVFGHGAGVVLLKRLDDALACGDQVLAVIRGFAINNDGAMKVGYTAPSVDGQANVIRRAQKMAGVTADSISYIEAHGTGTPLGDPIEVSALNKAFRSTTNAAHFCSLGTAKANVGHLDVAAGVTGLIKTVLQIENRTIPGLLHFNKPNPDLHIEGSPFFVDQQTRRWNGNGHPLRAGVSAFGVGGTNAHIIVEEPPVFAEHEPLKQARESQLIVWSAKTPSALAHMTDSLAAHFSGDPRTSLADAAFTLQAGRSGHKLRRAAVASSNREAASIHTLSGDALIQNDHPFANPRIAFCFPGQGIQRVGMGRGLYESEPVFSQSFDACDAILTPLLGRTMRSLIYPESTDADPSTTLNQTLYAQPAIFAFEYALAQLWLSWGIKPTAMVGHSVGEYVCACLAGVLTLEDALKLLTARSRLMQSLPSGSMLAVRTGYEKVASLIASSDAPLDIAAINSPRLCVVSGTDEAIDTFIALLDAEKIAHRKLVTSHAFHSRLMDPILDAFANEAAKTTFSSPTIPYVSTLTGNWITGEEVQQPDYWVRHLRQTVRFADAVSTLAAAPETILLEVGPAETLVQLMRQTVLELNVDKKTAPLAFASLARAKDGVKDEQAILMTLGRLWAAGATPDWIKLHSESPRKRVLLPTYPFDRKRFWIEPAQTTRSNALPAVIAPNTLIHSIDSLTHSADATFSLVPAEDSSMTISATAASDEAAMLNDLKALIADLSGTDLSDAEADASFLELGFDSLFLTQLTQGIQSKYRVKLTFRQIMESYPTLDSLAKHLEETVAPNLQPAKAAPTVQPAAPTLSQTPVTTVPATIVSAAAPGSLESLFASQMQAMNNLFQQQIELLRGQQPSATAPAAAPTAVPVARPVPPVTQAATVEAKPVKPAFVPFKPLQRGETGGLNPVQEEYLQSFIKTYNAKTGASQDLHPAASFRLRRRSSRFRLQCAA